MKNNYDAIARQYDFLSRLVFQKSQRSAQINQLQYIQPNSHILLAGGGTGWILEEITKVHPGGLHITYVEISGKMIQLSRQRNYGRNELNFVQSSILDFRSEKTYDVVMSPFLFDNFAEPGVHKAFHQMDAHLKEKGLWFFVDFNLNPLKGIWWKKLMLKLMYGFFKRISHIEARELIDLEKYFAASAYQKIEEKFYYGNFIKAAVYRKPDKP